MLRTQLSKGQMRVFPSRRHSAVTCAVVDVAVQQCFQCSSQCQSLNFWTCWAAASFASEKRMPTMSQCITLWHVAREQWGISLLWFLSPSICPWSLPPKALQLAEDLELTCDVRLLAGKGLGIVAQWWQSPQKRGSCYGLKHCRPMAGMAISRWRCKRRTRSAIRSQEFIEISTWLNVQWCFKYFRLFQGRLLFWPQARGIRDSADVSIHRATCRRRAFAGWPGCWIVGSVHCRCAEGSLKESVARLTFFVGGFFNTNTTCKVSKTPACISLYLHIGHVRDTANDLCDYVSLCVHDACLHTLICIMFKRKYVQKLD